MGDREMAEGTPYWTTEVQYFFNETDKNAMFAVSNNASMADFFDKGPLDLGDYTSVKTYAEKISDEVAQDAMPAGQSPKWLPDRKARFSAWIAAGCPLSPPAA
jgi:hypothetical protein